MTGPADTAAGRIRAFLDAWHKTHRYHAAVAACFPDDGMHELTEEDLRAVLNELEHRAEQHETLSGVYGCLVEQNGQLIGERRQLAARVTELEAQRDEEHRGDDANGGR